MPHDNDVYLDADLPALALRSVNLRKDLDEAIDIAGALETGAMPHDSKLPYYADLYFPDADTKHSAILIEESRGNWSQYFLRQVWWGVAFLDTQLKKPTLRTLCRTFDQAAEWSEADQRLHLEAVENLKQECIEGIEALTKDGFSTQKLTDKLNRTLSQDPSEILRTINTEARYLAFVENNLRSHFRLFAESAGAILETCRNDMAETYILYTRKNSRGRASRQMAEDLRYQGTLCSKELTRATEFHDMANTVLKSLKQHTAECEQRIATYGSLTPAESRPCLN